MEKQFIPLSVPNLKGNELAYVTEAVKTEWVSTAGPYIADFEKAAADYVHVPAACACQSGTAGLHLALKVLGIQPGEEVLVPTLTFVAAVNPVHYIGADPVFMDCDDTLTLDPKKLKRFCEEECEVDGNILKNKTSCRKVTALVVVHVFGNLADMEEIMSLAGTYHLKVIEDATEALGSCYREGAYEGRYAGTIGDIGVFSFNGNKIITTGGGGMVVSQNPELTERCRFLSTQAKKDTVYFVHEEIGYNYRMTNLQAALGLAQLEQLEEFIRIKKENYELYQKEGIKLLPFRSDIRSNYWFYSYLTDNRDGLIRYLEQHQIQSRPVWKLIHTLKPYAESRAYQIEKALWYYDRIVNIPCSSNLEGESVKRVAERIHSFLKEQT
ncbi:putative pyridoxal phosphate-dependent aminotransferase EpsN [Lachnospiraceae bacterium]|nr:putative pyridoxal phosphate-dependent aminotransferase EpsN [Lachnospiraceae bacterium]